MPMIEVSCQCTKKCGCTFEAPKDIIKRSEHYGDLLLSTDCPYTDFDNVSIVEKLEGFVVIYAPKEES